MAHHIPTLQGVSWQFWFLLFHCVKENRPRNKFRERSFNLDLPRRDQSLVQLGSTPLGLSLVSRFVFLGLFSVFRAGGKSLYNHTNVFLLYSPVTASFLFLYHDFSAVGAELRKTIRSIISCLGLCLNSVWLPSCKIMHLLLQKTQTCQTMF